MFFNFNSLLSERREIKCSKTEKVMRLVDRGDFAKDDLYEDCPQYIGCGATISAPHMVSWKSIQNTGAALHAVCFIRNKYKKH